MRDRRATADAHGYVCNLALWLGGERRRGAATAGSLYWVTELRHKIATSRGNPSERSDIVYSYT